MKAQARCPTQRPQPQSPEFQLWQYTYFPAFGTQKFLSQCLLNRFSITTLGAPLAFLCSHLRKTDSSYAD